MKQIALLLLFLTTTVFSQTKGIVVDENNKPIPYVSIWVENENSGTTSEENGRFAINVSDATKNLIFSSLGYEKKIVKASEASVVVLLPTAYNLKEVIVLNKKETKVRTIGETESNILQAFDNGPRIDAKYFPYHPSYKKTRFIKQITIFTDSSIENATIKIHLYSVDSNGFPGAELLEKDYIVSIKKGSMLHKFDVSEFNLIMPEEGIFAAYEKLMIESNKAEFKQTYYPLVLYNFVERDFFHTFSGGKWNRKTSDSSGKMRVFEPAINLKLTN
jgi:carboxypeptidase-like protein